MEDTYNFDEIRCLESYSFANLANDMGYFDEIFLLGDEYQLEIHFNVFLD